ncbi:coiled-coil domain-containing protein 57 [Turdus rufiventris]|nr:coiled-coil domain-containing protein 57 [Turdus rufiventris]
METGPARPGARDTACGLRPGAEPCGGSCRQEASRDWAFPSEGRTVAQHPVVPQISQYDYESSLCKDIHSLEIKKLQEQNASLRAAIAQMRKEMESLDKQMLSSLTLAEDRQLADQGSMSTNKTSTGTTLINIKVRSPKLDCIANSDTEEGPEPKVLEENTVDFGQQLCDAGTGDGCQYSVKCTLRGLQNKLKEAARKISILNQEKRQLIEMGNSLRAELGMVLKEVQDATMRYNQFYDVFDVKSMYVCKIVFEFEQVRLDFSIENHGPDTWTKAVQTQLLSQSPSQDQQVQLSSSRAPNFCQILDTGSILSLQSPRKNTSQVEFEVVHSIEQSEESRQSVKAKDKLEMSAEDLTVRGTRQEIQQKIKSRCLSCTHLLKPKIFSSMVKIRNYNIKD